MFRKAFPQQKKLDYTLFCFNLSKVFLYQSKRVVLTLLRGSNDPYGETLHSLLSLVRGKYLNIATWESKKMTNFCLTGGDDLESQSEFLLTLWHVLEHNGKKGGMNGIEDGDVFIGY